MDASAIVLLITSMLTAMVLGVLVAVTVSMLNVSRKINRRLDDLDDHLIDLVAVMTSLSETSQSELAQLHNTLAEQQRVHRSIRATSRLVDIVFRKPAVTGVALSQTASKHRARRKSRRNKSKKVETL